MIKRSSGQLVNLLIEDLDSEDPVRRESAIARLSLLGNRAVEQLCAVATGSGSGRRRAGALQALEGTAAPRSAAVAVAALSDEDEMVAVAATGLLARLLRGEQGAAALDALAAAVVDPKRQVAIRMAAFDALADLPAAIIEPIVQQLRSDPSAAMRRRAGAEPPADLDPSAELARIADAGLPRDVRRVRELVSQAAASLPLPTLHRLVTLIGERERSEVGAADREAWMAVRAAVHHVLASRGSRVALYDLRETLAAAQVPLPVEFVTAAALVGDASCLDPLASAYGRSVGNPWWQRHLGDAFAAIVEREGLTRRHGALRRVLARQPDLASIAGVKPVGQ
ncbi:MAG: hypothetical protein ACE148_04115 [Vicinamibacterales bacterium]